MGKENAGVEDSGSGGERLDTLDPGLLAEGVGRIADASLAIRLFDAGVLGTEAIFSMLGITIYPLRDKNGKS